MFTCSFKESLSYVQFGFMKQTDGKQEAELVETRNIYRILKTGLGGTMRLCFLSKFEVTVDKCREVNELDWLCCYSLHFHANRQTFPFFLLCREMLKR